MEPPPSSYEGVADEDFRSRRRQLQQEAWQHFAKPFKNGPGFDAYDRLARLEEAMADRLEDLTAKREDLKAGAEERASWRNDSERYMERVRAELGRIRSAIHHLTFRGAVLRNVRYQFEVFGEVPDKLSEGDLDEAETAPRPGRPPTIDDPSTHPVATLNTVLEWTDDDANRSRPFRGENSLCGFVSEQLKDEVGFEVPQDTVKARLRSMMDDLKVDLPHGPTNKRSYFEAREDIIEAMKERDLPVQL